MRKLNLLPVAAGVFNLVENASDVTMSAAPPAQHSSAAQPATLCTISKDSTLGLSILQILFGIAVTATKGFREQPA